MVKNSISRWSSAVWRVAVASSAARVLARIDAHSVHGMASGGGARSKRRKMRASPSDWEASAPTHTATSRSAARGPSSSATSSVDSADSASLREMQYRPSVAYLTRRTAIIQRMNARTWGNSSGLRSNSVEHGHASASS